MGQVDISAVQQYLHYCVSRVECNPFFSIVLLHDRKKRTIFTEAGRKWQALWLAGLLFIRLVIGSIWCSVRSSRGGGEGGDSHSSSWHTGFDVFFFSPLSVFLLSFFFLNKWIRQHKREMVRILTWRKWPLLLRNQCNAGLGIRFIPTVEQNKRENWYCITISACILYYSA